MQLKDCQWVQCPLKHSHKYHVPLLQPQCIILGQEPNRKKATTTKTSQERDKNSAAHKDEMAFSGLYTYTSIYQPR